MRRWKSHKVVEAEQIESAYMSDDLDGAILNLQDGEEFHVDPDTYERIRMMGGANRLPGSVVGGYVVRYMDGYVSWSPELAFIQGYTELGKESAGVWPAEQVLGWAWAEACSRLDDDEDPRKLDMSVLLARLNADMLEDLEG